jgi:hypothetical protein
MTHHSAPLCPGHHKWRVRALTAILFPATLMLMGVDKGNAESMKQETPNSLAWLQFLAAEVRELRRELLEDRIERQESRIRALGREIQQARAEREQVESERRVSSQQMLDIDRQLADPALPAEERQELATLRAEAISRGPTNRAATERNETQLSEKLRQEQLRLEWLRGLARALAPPSTGSQQ